MSSEEPEVQRRNHFIVLLLSIPMNNMNQQLLDRLDQLIAAVNRLAPASPTEIDWQAPAFRWRKHHGQGFLHPIHTLHPISSDDLQHIPSQKAAIYANTRQFIAGKPANNVLLTGARGTGKSSLIKAVLNTFKNDNLRLIEIDKSDLVELADIVALIANRPEYFILFCDDLSFEAGDGGYNALKTALDGSLTAPSANMLIYATSNRRHLLPEYHSDNAAVQHIDGEIHPGEAIEEKIALSERFGLWLTFYALNQQAYLSIAQHWLHRFGITIWNDKVESAALQWAMTRGARNGRVAWQFARDWAGKQPG